MKYIIGICCVGISFSIGLYLGYKDNDCQQQLKEYKRYYICTQYLNTVEGCNLQEIPRTF